MRSTRPASRYASTRQNWVPVLVTDEDEVIEGSQKIVDWAKANPKTASDAA